MEGRGERERESVWEGRVVRWGLEREERRDRARETNRQTETQRDGERTEGPGRAGCAEEMY